MTRCLASGDMEAEATWRDVCPGRMLSLPKLTNALTCSLSWRGDLKGLDVTGNNYIDFYLPSFTSRYWLAMHACDLTTLIVVSWHYRLLSRDLNRLNLPRRNNWSCVHPKLFVWWHMNTSCMVAGGKCDKSRFICGETVIPPSCKFRAHLCLHQTAQSILFQNSKFVSVPDFVWLNFVHLILEMA